jgi:integrase
MPIYRQTQKGKPYGNFFIDRVIRGRRIKLNTGTKDKKTAKEMDAVIDQLKTYGLDDKLELLITKKISIRQLYLERNAGVLLRPVQGNPEFSAPLRPIIETWCETYRNWNEQSRRNNRFLLNAFWERVENKEPTIQDIPLLLKEYRQQMEEVARNRTFTLTRAIFTKFFAEKYGRIDKLYLQIKDVPNLSLKPKNPATAKTPAQIERFVGYLKPHHAQMVWFMCAHGLGWKEYSQSSEGGKEHPRIVIEGSKTDRHDGRRRREIPKVMNFVEQVGDGEHFARVIRRAARKARIGKVVPYTFRKCFSVWASEAGVPNWRVEMYMGHSPKTMTTRYQRHEIWGWLREDGSKIRQYIEEERLKSGRVDRSESAPLLQNAPFRTTLSEKENSRQNYTAPETKEDGSC